MVGDFGVEGVKDNRKITLENFAVRNFAVRSFAVRIYRRRKFHRKTILPYGNFAVHKNSPYGIFVVWKLRRRRC